MARTPQEIAEEIVDRFSWSTNVVVDGLLVGQQWVVARAIAEAIQAERERCAKIADAQAIADQKRWSVETDWRQPYASNRVICTSWAIASAIRKPVAALSDNEADHG